ncbi:MAG: cytochrome P450 [Myxococcota bacterium]
MPGFPSLTDPDFVADPFPIYTELRKHDPAHWDETFGAWLITRYADVWSLLPDPRLSTDRRLGHDFRPAEGDGWVARFERLSLLHQDVEGHRRWRRRLSIGFTPRAVRRQERQVREIVEDFAAPLRGRRGRIDLIREFLDPIPNTVIARIVGIPPFPGDEARFRALAQDMIRRFFTFADAATVARGNAATEELGEWVFKLAEDRRQQPGEDMISDLIHGAGDAEGQRDGDAMTSEEVASLVTMLVSAGSETTTLGGCQMLRNLMLHPAELAKLRADRSLVPNAVRECLRFNFGSIAPVNPRYALEDVPLHGRTIRKGDMVLLSTGAANRDPEAFPDPDRLDVTRDTRGAATFGHGPRYCLGANLALQELECMLEAALDFLPPSARLADEEIEWEQVGVMRRPMHFPVDFG